MINITVQIEQNGHKSFIVNTVLQAMRRSAAISLSLLIIVTMFPCMIAAGDVDISKLSSEWADLQKNVENCKFDSAYMQVSQISPLLGNWNGEQVKGKKLPERSEALKHLNNLLKLRSADEYVKLEEWTDAKTTLNVLLKPENASSIYDSKLYSHAITLLKTTNDNIIRQKWDNRINEANALLKHGLATKAKDLFKEDDWKPGVAPGAVRSRVEDIVLRADTMNAIGSWRGDYEQAFVDIHGFAKDIWIMFIVIGAFLILSVMQMLWFSGFQAIFDPRPYSSKNIIPNKLNTFLRWLAPNTLFTSFIAIKNLCPATDKAGKLVEDHVLGDRLAQVVDSLCAGHYRYSDEAEALTIAESSQPSTKAINETINTEVVMTAPAPLNLGVIKLNISPLLSWLQNIVSTKRFATRYEGTIRMINNADSGIAYEIFLRRCRLYKTEHYYAYIYEDIKCSEQFEQFNWMFDKLVESIAFQIAVSTGGCVTHNAMSLQHYFYGMNLLEQQIDNPTSQNNLKEAKKHFYKALSFDPDNWLARFYLGYVLRRLDKHLDAAAQFLLINDALKSPFNEDQSSVGRKHLHYYQKNRYKQLTLFLQREANYCRSHSVDINILNNAVKDLDKLIIDKDLDELIIKWESALQSTSQDKKIQASDEDGHHNPDPCRLLWLCRAAKVVACTNIYEHVADAEKFTAVSKSWEIFNSESESRCKLPPQDVKAMADAAYGRALYRHGNTEAEAEKINTAKKAIEILWQAVNMQSGFSKSEPYEMLCRIYLDMQENVSIEWNNKCSDCLDMLKEIIPDSEKLSSLNTEFLDKTGKSKDVTKEIATAGSTAEALELKSKIEPSLSKTAAPQTITNNNDPKPE